MSAAEGLVLIGAGLVAGAASAMAGGAGDGVVEAHLEHGHVRPRNRLVMRQRCDVADDVLELGQRGRIGAAGGPGRVLGLEGHAELRQLAGGGRAEAQQVAERAGHELGARLGDEGAPARARTDLEHALGLQGAQRLAQRGTRDAEGRAQIPFARQPLTRSDAARRDRVADLPDDVVERAHALRRDECGAGGGGFGHGLTASE